MYHPRIQDRQAHKRRMVIAAIAGVALCVAVAFAIAAGSSAVREQSALSMRTAIMDSAKQCAAIEGAYPRSIDYLQKHYGLIVNERDYVITYECYADNVAPSVVVVPR